MRFVSSGTAANVSGSMHTAGAERELVLPARKVRGDRKGKSRGASCVENLEIL